MATQRALAGLPFRVAAGTKRKPDSHSTSWNEMAISEARKEGGVHFSSLNVNPARFTPNIKNPAEAGYLNPAERGREQLAFLLPHATKLSE